MWGRMDFVKQKNQDQRCSKVVGGQGRTRRGPGRTKARGRGGRRREGGGDGEMSAEGARAQGRVDEAIPAAVPEWDGHAVSSFGSVKRGHWFVFLG